MKIAQYLLAGPVLFLAGCSFDVQHGGPLEHETRSVDLDKSELVKVDLKMGAGDLNVSGGSSKLMDADFAYNVPSWKPVVRYENTGVRGYLTVEQPRSGPAGNTKNTWDIRLNDRVATDIKVNFGAGEAHLNLGSLPLRSVELEMGAGELKLDLRGDPKRDYDVRVRGGVGEATIYLPKSAGILANASGGLGGIQVTGLHKEDGHYVNDEYAKAKVKINVDVRGGIGQINLLAE
jgi:hypothetical protein